MQACAQRSLLLVHSSISETEKHDIVIILIQEIILLEGPTITRSSINIEIVTRVTRAGIGTNSVDAGMVTLMD